MDHAVRQHPRPVTSSQLLLIGIAERCIVEAKPGARYIGMSYV
jgi:hypothetical protein